MKKIKAFLTKIIQSDSKESSKRFSAIFSLLVATILSFVYTREHTLSIILPMWLSFILTLLGFAVWEKIKKDDKGN